MKAAERIYVASTSDGASQARLAEDLARRIEDDIAAREISPGAALGSLRELAERHGVGRSVVREAVGLLEQRGLGRMRPGPCGGFILASPQPERSGAALAEHFRATGMTLPQLLDAREAVDLMAARLAARACIHAGHDPSGLQRATESPGLQAALQLRAQLARMAGEPALVLMVECLNTLTLDHARESVAAPLRAGSPALVRALREGDADAAAEEMSRLNEGLQGLLGERDDAGRFRAESLLRLPARTAKLPATIARELAMQIARDGRAGMRLGSEWALCERFNVSRLTLRQAVRLLQDNGLVECRRGRGNGLVVRDRPAAGGIRLMMAYLIANRMDPNAAGTLLFQLNSFVPALAVSRADAAGRRQLAAALERLETCDSFERYDLLGLVHCVSRLAQSPLIDLFSRCLAAYEARFLPSLAERLPKQAQASYFGLVRRLLAQRAGAGEFVLERAKRESAALMLEMSFTRPI
jgi:DNA-binding FadR family transcriptional regulator